MAFASNSTQDSSSAILCSSVTGERMEDLMHHWKTQGSLSPDETDTMTHILGLDSNLDSTFEATMKLELRVYDDVRFRLIGEAADWEEVAAWQEVFTIRMEFIKYKNQKGIVFDPSLKRLCIMVTQLLPTRMDKRNKKPGRKIDDINWYEKPLHETPGWYQSFFKDFIKRHVKRSELRMIAQEGQVRQVYDPKRALKGYPAFASATTKDFHSVDIGPELWMRIFGKMERREAKSVGLLDII